MRYAQVAWRVFLSVFLQGAWSCLNQNIDVKARRSFSASVAVSFVNKAQSLKE